MYAPGSLSPDEVTMKYLMNKTKLIAVLAITVLLVILGVLNLRDRLATPSVADDGVEWVNTANGIQAKSVRPDTHIAVKKKKKTKNGMF